MQLSIKKRPNHSVNKPVSRRPKDVLGTVSSPQGIHTAGCLYLFCVWPQVQLQNDFIHFLRNSSFILYVSLWVKAAYYHLFTKHLTNCYFISMLIADSMQLFWWVLSPNMFLLGKHEALITSSLYLWSGVQQHLATQHRHMVIFSKTPHMVSPSVYISPKSEVVLRPIVHLDFIKGLIPLEWV